MKKQYLTGSYRQTKKLGEKLAEEILKSKPLKRAFIIGLEGELGGGKTTFLQGFAKGLGIKEKILSPTFVIIRRFPICVNSCLPRRSRPVGILRGSNPPPTNLLVGGECKFASLYHIDCYRIQKPEDLLVLGLREIISNPQNIVTIEWADCIKKILPKDILILKFKFIDDKKRKIIFLSKKC